MPMLFAEIPALPPVGLEIAAAVELGAVALSRLDRDASRAREIHRKLGTNLIVERYDMAVLRQIFHGDNSRMRA